ncbi:MAG: hypothetical protein GY856_19820, partial [bacterium]|nr:hypothetical protein [bacterium]
ATLARLETSEVLPLFLPFRAYVRRSHDLSLPEFLEEQARVDLHSPLPEGFLEEALEAGRAVLLLDGLDEVDSAGEREDMLRKVEAFCERFQRVPALVTSRIAGYEDAPLPDAGPEGFEHHRIEPFDNAGLERFVRRWYALRPEHDRAADLIAALRTHDALRELARNPMLATLIALVHRVDARLPGERAKIYERLVLTLLEKWPEERRGDTFSAEFDAGLQRAYLEELAYRMQRGRTSLRDERNRGIGVELGRGELVAALIEIIARRQGTASVPEVEERRVERWVRFLEERTGILVEQRPGVFGFLHLSLMEYLVACVVVRNENPAAAVAERFSDSVWREVCLLAVGRRATVKTFLNALYARLAEEPGGWSFLRACLEEEADFDETQRIRILRGAGAELLDQGVDIFRQCSLYRLMHSSFRHADWTRRWIRRELDQALGANLRSIVMLDLSREDEVRKILEQRTDAEQAAVALLDFWPRSRIGNWAAGSAEPERARQWGRSSDGSLLAVRSRRAFNGWEIQGRSGAALTHGLLIALAHCSRAMAVTARVNLPTLERIPGSIAVRPGEVLLHTAPIVHGADLSSRVVRGRYFARRFYLFSAKNFAFELLRRFEKALELDLAELFDPEKLSPLTDFFSRYFWRFTIHSTTHVLGEHLRRKLGTSFSLSFAPAGTSEEEPLGPPTSGWVSDDVKAWRNSRRNRDAEDLIDQLTPAYARFAAEAWIGLAATAGADRETRLAMVHYRVENARLLAVWPEWIDSSFPGLSRPPSDKPDRLALYLALGRSQATTTHAWPATPAWRRLLGGDPPVHWLPRSQWHLCWLLCDPDDADHLSGLDDALREGLEDVERPDVARELRRLFPAPPHDPLQGAFP